MKNFFVRFFHARNEKKFRRGYDYAAGFLLRGETIIDLKASPDQQGTLCAMEDWAQASQNSRAQAPSEQLRALRSWHWVKYQSNLEHAKRYREGAYLHQAEQYARQCDILAAFHLEAVEAMNAYFQPEDQLHAQS